MHLKPLSSMLSRIFNAMTLMALLAPRFPAFAKNAETEFSKQSPLPSLPLECPLCHHLQVRHRSGVPL